MNTKKTLVIAIALVAGVMVAGIAAAQSAHHGPAKQEVSAGGKTAASLAFRAAGEKMHRDMAITYSGDVDVDFVRGMIPHHQGAIDMAKALLVHGKDAEVRKLAEGIIKAQESEIAFIRGWLKKQGK